MVNEAKNKGHWIYEPSYKHWYTPEHFKHIYKTYLYAKEDFLNSLQIRNPLEGIEAGFKRLEDMQSKLLAGEPLPNKEAEYKKLKELTQRQKCACYTL
ncbi:MAG: hypothetical protein JWQ96_895 [Segetibacter sp.]|nr:hypothetical protein [Segetibacter sp.]